MVGDPDPEHISTSHVEWHNLTMRMSMHRFTRLTNAFSKKVANHVHAQALYFVWYNFCRVHMSLYRNQSRWSPLASMRLRRVTICPGQLPMDGSPR